MKILVVGGVAGGASAAARIRRLDAQAEIIIFERGPHVSFSNCCLPYHLGGIVADSESLVLMTPEKFKKQHDIEVRTHSEVIDIDREQKLVTVRDTETEDVYQEAYDKLVLSPGASPVRPSSIEGIDRENVFTVRNVVDIQKLKSYLDRDDVRRVTVVGGGFIGIEVAENISKAGKEVAIVEGMDQILMPFDHDMVQTLQKELLDHGVKIYLSARVTAIREKGVVICKDNSEKILASDAVVMAVGVKPETELALKAHLEIGRTGGIKVNEHFQTSDPDIYAVGDVIESYNSLTGREGRLTLAGPAQRQARAAADHICSRQKEEIAADTAAGRVEADTTESNIATDAAASRAVPGIRPSGNRGFIGSSCIRVFSQNAACTGLNERAALAAGFDCDSVIVYPFDKVSLMPDKAYMGFKLVFELKTGRILGAQAIGRGNVDKRVDVIAAMITMGATLDDLKELELCYSPVFGTAKDVVNMAALVGLNILDGVYRQVHVSEVRDLVASGAYIIDVREENEYAAGHIVTAVNIPLSQLRGRMDQVPKDRPVYLHCRSSQRSYYALKCLQNNGWDNIVNISGSYLGISLYEYFTDVTEGRQPILTAYNFN